MPTQAHPTLHRLIYCSAFDAFPTPPAAQDDEIIRIVDSSVRNNRKVGVTGMLLVHGGWFIQALEGPAEGLTMTYDRIMADRRHRELCFIGAGPIAKREFAPWTMSARRLGSADGGLPRSLGLDPDFDPRTLNPDQAIDLLAAFKPGPGLILAEVA